MSECWAVKRLLLPMRRKDFITAAKQLGRAIRLAYPDDEILMEVKFYDRPRAFQAKFDDHALPEDSPFFRGNDIRDVTPENWRAARVVECIIWPKGREKQCVVGHLGAKGFYPRQMTLQMNGIEQHRRRSLFVKNEFMRQTSFRDAGFDASFRNHHG